jgi:hypothetical protein
MNTFIIEAGIILSGPTLKQDPGVIACSNQEKYSVKALLLLVAAAGGALLAAVGLPGNANGPLPLDAIAQLPGKSISRAHYLQVLEQVAADRRSPMTAEDRWRLLDRLIEEQLLIDRSLAIDLPRINARVRKTIVNSIFEMAINDAASTSGNAEKALQEYVAELRELAQVRIYEKRLARHAARP